MDIRNKHFIEVPTLYSNQLSSSLSSLDISNIQNILDICITDQLEIMNHSLFSSSIVLLNKTILPSNINESINLILSILFHKRIFGSYEWEYINSMNYNTSSNLYFLSNNDGTYKRKIDYYGNNINWYLYKVLEYCHSRFPTYTFSYNIHDQMNILQPTFSNAILTVTYKLN